MARLFLAVWPPERVVDQLRALPRPPLRGVRWTGADQWHVTLRFFGEAEPDEAEAAARGLRAAAGEVALGPTTARLGRSVLALPARGLDELAVAVADVTRSVGRPPDRRPFLGHLTVARLRRGAAPVDPLDLEAHWTVGSVALVESRLLPTGAAYRTLTEVPLRSDGTAVAGEDGEPGDAHRRHGQRGVDDRDDERGGDEVEREDAL